MVHRSRWSITGAAIVATAASLAGAQTAPVAGCPTPPALATQRAARIGELGAARCYGELARLSVAFDRVAPHEAPGVEMPIRLRGPVGSVSIAPVPSPHDIMDCRLVLALAAWTPVLRAAAVTRLDHFSAYRPRARVAGSRRVSAHAHAMAIDISHVSYGERRLSILTDWTARRRRAAPCEDSFDEGIESARLRALVCAAADSGAFQVVLTPHHDRAHQNHIHLEVRPNVPWIYLR